MKGGILMRVLLCKIQCPFMCFCKPSAANHFYTSAPLKLQNSPHVVVPSSTTDFSVSEKPSSQDVMLKSCLRKVPQGTEVAKKRVQWIDISGNQLAEIKEFESRGIPIMKKRTGVVFASFSNGSFDNIS
ncbi:hypothetical protein CASFOL_022916 [Castilleja foliolosa]|uniref:Uncharacterized protein n=1 Tax=Castilleja foliolosa TaxID=1961234 RepID=A0ABD3CV27_9LAMI